MKCISCGNEVENDARFCANCGYPVSSGNSVGLNEEKRSSSVWKCPKCETLNEGEACVICGEKKIVFQSVNGNGADKETEYNKAYAQNENNRRSREQRRKQKNIIIAVCSVIIGLIIGLSGVFYYFVICENKKIENNEIKEELPKKKAEPSEKPQRTAVENVENKVLDIRNWYKDTQNNLKSLSAVKATNGITKYYNKSDCVRIDVPADEKNNYNRYYYLKNNKLYFVFAFDGKKENRLYFYNETLFRWIDENGIVHDNDFSNKDFILWESNILNELAVL